MEEENIWKKCNKLYSNEGDFYKYEVHSIKNILLPPPHWGNGFRFKSGISFQDEAFVRNHLFRPEQKPSIGHSSISQTICKKFAAKLLWDFSKGILSCFFFLAEVLS